MNLKQLRQDRVDNDAAQARLKAEGRKLMAGTQTDETKARITAINAELDQLAEKAAEITASIAQYERFAEDERQAPRVEVGRDLAADRPFASFGEQLVAIASAMTPGGVRDPRLVAAVSGASAGEPSSGAFMIQTGYSDALLARAREESPILGMMNQIPIPAGNESLDLPVFDETSRATGSRWGGVQVYRKAEAETVTAKKPKFGKLKIDTSEIMGIAYATDRLLRHAPTVEAIFGNAFASEFAFKVTDEFVRGGGGDELVGVVSAACTVEQAAEGGQTSSEILSENLSKMWAHVPARSKARGVWLINNDVEPALDKLYTQVGTTALEPRFVTYDQSGVMKIKGRPVMHLEQCSTLGTKGDIMFVDPSEYILSPQGAIEGASSMHVRFLYNEMTFRWNYYVNGRPAWLSALTPYKGATSLSPFVALATRS